MCSLFENLYVLSTWDPHMVYMGFPYILYIYMIKCGWLGIYIYILWLLFFKYYYLKFNINVFTIG